MLYQIPNLLIAVYIGAPLGLFNNTHFYIKLELTTGDGADSESILMRGKLPALPGLWLLVTDASQNGKNNDSCCCKIYYGAAKIGF
jgi:hypothetical protein